MIELWGLLANAKWFTFPICIIFSLFVSYCIYENDKVPTAVGAIAIVTGVFGLVALFVQTMVESGTNPHIAVGNFPVFSFMFMCWASVTGWLCAVARAICVQNQGRVIHGYNKQHGTIRILCTVMTLPVILWLLNSWKNYLL